MSIEANVPVASGGVKLRSLCVRCSFDSSRNDVGATLTLRATSRPEQVQQGE
jgi:hypothetical protein